MYDGKNDFLLQIPGSGCNKTAGTCSVKGQCENVKNFCARPENDLKPCSGNRYTCQGGTCKHVCDGNVENECICEAGGPFECEICCLSGKNRTCEPINEPGKPFMVRPYGSQCNFTRGICLENGICDSVANHPFFDNSDDGGGCDGLKISLSFLFALILTMVILF